MEVTAGENDSGRRLDRILRRLWSSSPLSHIHRELRRGTVEVNGTPRGGSYRVQAGDRISLPTEEDLATRRTKPRGGQVHRLPPVAPIFENEHIAAFDKPAGVPTIGKDSLADAVVPRLAETATDSLSFTPGPLHRLDRNTTGLLLFSKSLKGAQRFTELQEAGRLTKVYLGIVAGALYTGGSWDYPLTRDTGRKVSRVDEKGRESWTGYWPLAVRQDPDAASLLLFTISSGFTHQIRAHTGAAGHPLMGDRKYGSPAGRPVGSYLLHAGAILTDARDEVLEFEILWAPPPKRFLDALDSQFGPEIRRAMSDFRRFQSALRDTLEP